MDAQDRRAHRIRLHPRREDRADLRRIRLSPAGRAAPFKVDRPVGIVHTCTAAWVAFATACAAFFTVLVPAAILAGATLATVVTASRATGEIAPEDVEAVRERWARAIADPDRLAEISSIHATWDTEMLGFRGTFERWTTRDGALRIALNLGGLDVVQTLSDGRAWQRDQAGQTRERTGNELRADVSDAYFWSFGPITPARTGLATLRFERISDAGLWVYKCHPLDGIEMAIFLDPATFLPVRYVEPRENRTISTELSDWRDIEGIRFPHRARRDSEEPTDRATFVLRHVELNQPVAPELFQRPDDRSRALRFDRGTEAWDIPIQVREGVIYVQAGVEGSPPAWFVLDSATGMTVLDTGWAESLGIRPRDTQAAGTAGAPPVDLVSDLEIRLPGLTLSEIDGALLPLDNVSALAGRPLGGILGADLFERLVVHIDYAEELLHLHDPLTFEYFGNGREVPLRIEGRKPHLALDYTLPGGEPTPVELVVDTASSDEVFFSAGYTTKEALVETLTQKVQTAGTHPGGHQRRWMGRIEKLAIGPLARAGVAASFAIQDDPSAGLFGALGGGFLRHFECWFDFRGKRLILEPKDALSLREGPRTGLLVRDLGFRGDHQFQIFGVVPGSPAEAAGLRGGEQIISIGGVPVASLDLFEVRARLESFDAKFRMEVSKAAVTTAVELIPRELF